MATTIAVTVQTRRQACVSRSSARRSVASGATTSSAFQDGECVTVSTTAVTVPMKTISSSVTQTRHVTAGVRRRSLSARTGSALMQRKFVTTLTTVVTRATKWVATGKVPLSNSVFNYVKYS